MKDCLKNKTKYSTTKSKSNKDELNLFLKWAKNFCKDKKLKLNGFWTYDNDYFSWEYLAKLIQNKYIIINKDLGKKPKPEKIDTGALKSAKLAIFIKKLAAENQVQPWYYKSEGKIFEKDVLKKDFKVRDKWEILNKFKQTKKILFSHPEQEKYRVHADWWGIYFLILASLPGRTFHEKKFDTTELYGLRDFIEKEKPKGAVLSYITSDKKCPIHNINLSPILNIFNIPELQYFKLLFVSKVKVMKMPTTKPWPEDAIGLGLFDAKFIAVPRYDNKVEWVLAYSK